MQHPRSDRRALIALVLREGIPVTPESVERTRVSRPPTELHIAGWLSVATGLTVVSGWVLGLPALTSIVPGEIAMKFNTALIFVVFGFGAVVLGAPSPPVPRQWGYSLMALAALAAAVIGLQYVVGGDFGIDQLLVAEPAGAVGTVHLGRLSPQTSLSFVALAGAAFATRLRYGAYPATVVMAAIALLLGAMNVVDFLFGAEVPTFLAAYTQMAVPTAVALAALAVGVMGLLPRGGPLGVMWRGEGSAAFGRPMLAAAVLIPIVVAWLRLEGERRGLYETAYGVTIMTLSTVMLFVIAVGVAAARIHRVEQDRERARREAEMANHAKSEFLSRMSHELRTPLNSVIGFAQVLEMDGLEPEQREHVGYIAHAGRHLLDLIDEVLDIARIDSGTMTISLEAVSVSEVADEARNLIAPLAAQRDVTIVAEIGCADLHVMADRQRLRQVLLNLVSNAVKYNRPGGFVRIECSERSDGVVQLEISDTGRGISTDDLQRLFTPFDRLGAEQTDVEGTGLGLALSRALVEAMQGTLRASSQVGIGSTFSIELRRAAAPTSVLPEPRPPIAVATADSPQRTVLYIEDNLANLRLVERIVERLPNVRLISAMQGRLGLDIAIEQQPDLILLDLHLADMNGMEVLRELRSRSSTPPNVVMLTADGTPWRANQLLEEGALAYLTKPLDVPRFLEVLEMTLGVRDESRAS